MDVLTKIESDHQEIRRRISNVNSVLSSVSSMREPEYLKLKTLVLIHHEAEQKTLLAELAQHSVSRSKALHLVEEHGEHKKVIKQMNELKADLPDWVDRFKELRDDLLHHIEEEEKELFELTREALTKEERFELGRKMVAATSEASL